MISAKTLCAVVLLSTSGFAQSIVLPSSLNLQAINSTGVNFTFSGTLTQAATISLTVSGAACEQGVAYCTNASGVLTVAGSSPVGAATTFTGPVGGFSGTYDFGSVIMTIAGVGSRQIFLANAANGLGSGSPPSTLTLSNASLASLGFPVFSGTNPVITFTVADTNYGDNSGSFTVTPGGSSPAVTPAPGTIALVVLGLAALTLVFRFKRRTTTFTA